ncbi:MAG: TetR/AcrR family transcriptional regulator [Mycobacterium sp.]|nr:TetR/AcrR family transcriptional regulator [Mycobacterium sp.]
MVAIQKLLRGCGRCHYAPILSVRLDGCQVSFSPNVVQGRRVSTQQDAPSAAGHDRTVSASKRRGDRQRQAILQAVRELLEEKPFAELSVSTISDRAGVARSGFYFYFDSKYSVLAQILAEATHELEELTQYFAPRGPDESPAAFAKRMVGSAAAVYAHNDPVMSACNVARNTDAEIRKILDQQVDTVIDQVIGVVEDEIKAGTAHPISDDIPALVRTLAVSTALMLSGDTTFLGPDGDVQRGVRVLEQLWLNALWGGRSTTMRAAELAERSEKDSSSPI